MSDYNIDKCPHCGGTSLLVQVATWMDFKDGEPASFDSEGHLDCAVPIIGGAAFCLTCNRDEWDIERLAGGVEGGLECAFMPAEAVERYRAAAADPAPSDTTGTTDRAEQLRQRLN